MNAITTPIKYKIFETRIRFWKSAADTARSIEKASLQFQKMALDRATEACQEMLACALEDMGGFAGAE